MSAIALSREYLESLLRERKLDHTLTDERLAPISAGGADLRWVVPTGMAELDTRLEGGLPRGHLSEVIGPRSSGRLAILTTALAGATLRGEAVALIDPLDMFDPVSASAITGTSTARTIRRICSTFSVMVANPTSGKPSIAFAIPAPVT